MKKFQRHQEDFTCENCGTFVKGNGYTDHCPKCLFGKHVDINPGDRACTCHGLLEPINVENYKDGYRISYKCKSCGHEFTCKSADDDNFDALLKLAKNRVFK